MSHDFDEEEFEELKRRSFLQVLFKAARLANEYAIERVREQTGRDWVRPAHTNLFPHVPFDGIRLTDLADRLGVTKQAVQVLVDDLTDGGVLERIPDPEDGRAKLIRWTATGREGLSSGVEMLLEIESEVAGDLEDADLRQAHDTLLAIVDRLETK